jgi:Tol biopolymer transport system component
MATRGLDGQILAATCFSPVLSEVGSCVAFVSSAANLVAGDTNGHLDVFLYDWAQDRIRCLSAFDETTPSNGMSMDCDMSEDGTKVAFSSRAWNLGCSDLNGAPDIYLWKR